MAQNLAVDCVLGTSCIDLHVEAVIPGLQKVVSYHTLSVTITDQRFSIEPKISVALVLEDRSQKIRRTRKATIRLLSQAERQAHCSTEGLCFVQSTPRLATEHLTLMASEIKNIFPHKNFYVLLSNFSSRPIHLSKSLLIGHELEVPKRIPIADAPKPHLLQSKKGGGIAEIFGSSDEDSSQLSNVSLEQ